jgi:NitT/TauT family transport system ATP-binding protein
VLIRLIDVVKVFESGKRELLAIDGVTLDVRDGEFVAIVGPSGCGKSTLLSLIAELERPTSGSVEFIGEQRTATRTAMVWQDYRLLPWRVIERNVALGPEFRERPEDERQNVVQRLLGKVRLRGFELFFPHQLSGGMKQKAGIARALANDPEILLMDEPFSALDAITRDQMNVALSEILEKYNKTVIFVTHSIREAAFLSDRVVVMGGRPSGIMLDMPMPFPRPRRFDIEDSAEFAQVCRKLRLTIEEAHGDGYGGHTASASPHASVIE